MRRVKEYTLGTTVCVCCKVVAEHWLTLFTSGHICCKLSFFLSFFCYFDRFERGRRREDVDDRRLEATNHDDDDVDVDDCGKWD